MPEETSEAIETVDRLSRELRYAAKRMTPQQARFLVANYYQIQENRIRSSAQLRAAEEASEASPVSSWLFEQMHLLENRVRSLLDAYSMGDPLGKSVRSVLGIGPVIAAGLIAHIDMDVARTAGAIWAYGGLDPRVIWESAEDVRKRLQVLFPQEYQRNAKPSDETLQRIGLVYHRRIPTLLRYAQPLTFDSLATALARRPWNAEFKVLCWKIGQSFTKISGNEKSFYGAYYRLCRADETIRNDRGEYQGAAAEKLQKFRISPSTEAYKIYSQGKLPDPHLTARAQRRVVKLFLSHYFEVAFRAKWGVEPPRPWIIEHGGHTHYIPVPPEWIPTPAAHAKPEPLNRATPAEE